MCFEDKCNQLVVGENSTFEDCGFYVSGKNNEIMNKWLPKEKELEELKMILMTRYKEKR